MLTPEERVSIKHHLGYPNQNMIETFVLGVPQALETLFVIEGAMNAIAPQAEERVRRTLERLERVDRQIEDNQDALVLSKTDDVEFRADEFELLLKRYRYWQGELCNLLGVASGNPFDARFSGALGGGINMTVVR